MLHMPQQTITGAQVEVSLESVFAMKKGREKTVMPGTFQVSAKIDEESRKDNRLEMSFLLTLADPKSKVTYEFRGTCAVNGSEGFDYLMESRDGSSRLPKILDVIYQRIYPSVFLLAGMTSSPYPHSTILGSELSPAPLEEPPIAEVQAAQPEQKS